MKEDKRKKDRRYADPLKADAIALLTAVPATRHKMRQDKSLIEDLMDDVHSLHVDYSTDKDRIDITPTPKDFAEASDRAHRLSDWYAREHAADFDFIMAVRELVGELESREDEALLLTRFFDTDRVKTYPEIAEILHFSEKWVQLHLSESLYALQRLLVKKSNAGTLPECFRDYLCNSSAYSYDFRPAADRHDPKPGDECYEEWKEMQPERRLANRESFYSRT